MRKPAPDFSDGLGRRTDQRSKTTDNLILQIGNILAAKFSAAGLAQILLKRTSAYHNFKIFHQRKPKPTQIGMFTSDAINPSDHHLR